MCVYVYPDQQKVWLVRMDILAKEDFLIEFVAVGYYFLAGGSDWIRNSMDSLWACMGLDQLYTICIMHRSPTEAYAKWSH